MQFLFTADMHLQAGFRQSGRNEVVYSNVLPDVFLFFAGALHATIFLKPVLHLEKWQSN